MDVFVDLSVSRKTLTSHVVACCWPERCDWVYRMLEISGRWPFSLKPCIISFDWKSMNYLRTENSRNKCRLFVFWLELCLSDGGLFDTSSWRVFFHVVDSFYLIKNQGIILEHENSRNECRPFVFRMEL